MLEIADRATALTGAPVLVDGRVVGIVTSTDGEVRALPWTSVAGELAEWAPEIRDAVWPVGPVDNQGPVQGTGPGHEFSTATQRVLGWYDAVQTENGEEAPPSRALWTAVVLDAEAFPNQTLAVLVPQHLEHVSRPAEKTLSKMASDPAQSARDWFGIRVLPREPNPATNRERLAALDPVLVRAAEFRDATQPGGGPIHLRVLLAALVDVWPADLEQAGGDAGRAPRRAPRGDCRPRARRRPGSMARPLHRERARGCVGTRGRSIGAAPRRVQRRRRRQARVSERRAQRRG